MNTYGRSQQGSINRGLAKNNGCRNTAIGLIVLIVIVINYLMS